jgi:uncharacterized protein (DUF1501 family)
VGPQRVGTVVTETQTVDLARKVSINATVYGGTDGAVAFLDMPEGVISPPYIAHMVRLGDVPSVITQALRASRSLAPVTNRRPALQKALADHLGVLQQSISRWTEGTHPPELTSEQWARVVKLVFTEWDGEKWTP